MGKLYVELPIQVLRQGQNKAAFERGWYRAHELFSQLRRVDEGQGEGPGERYVDHELVSKILNEPNYEEFITSEGESCIGSYELGRIKAELFEKINFDRNELLVGELTSESLEEWLEETGKKLAYQLLMSNFISWLENEAKGS